MIIFKELITGKILTFAVCDRFDNLIFLEFSRERLYFGVEVTRYFLSFCYTDSFSNDKLFDLMGF